MAGRKPTRTTRASSAEYPCTRCGQKIRTMDDARKRCPTPGDPYDRPSYSGPPAGHSLHPRDYMNLQIASAPRRNGGGRSANENMCPDCASAPRANPGRECGDCGSWVCAHTSVEKRGAVQCLPCRNGTDCGCGGGGGCSCLFAFGECRCERIVANRGRSSSRSRGRPSLREIERRAASLSRAHRNPRELEVIEAMAAGRDPSGRREDDYPGWSDGDFEELLVIHSRNGRRAR